MIVAVPKNTLTPVNKALLTKKGFIVIECDDPDKIRVINPEQSMGTSDWFMAALFALSRTSSGATQDNFLKDLHKRLSEKEIPSTNK